MAVTISTAVGSLQGLTGGNRMEGSRRRVTALITGDTSYPTGGYALSAGSFGLNSLDRVIPDGVDQSGAVLVVWNNATQKLQLFSALGTEVVNATNVSARSVLVEAEGS